MQQLGFLLFSVLLPIFLQIGAGYALQKRFPLNTATLSKVQFYPSFRTCLKHYQSLDSDRLL